MFILASAAILSGCRINQISATRGVSPQPIPTLEGQVLGEPIGSFTAGSADLKGMLNTCKDSLSSECTLGNRLNSPSYSGVLHCDSKNRSLDVCRSNRGAFVFRDGKLTAVEFIERNNWSQPSTHWSPDSASQQKRLRALERRLVLSVLSGQRLLTDCR